MAIIFGFADWADQWLNWQRREGDSLMESAEGRLKISASLQNPSEDVNRVCRLVMVKPMASPKTAGISSSVTGFFCRY